MGLISAYNVIKFLTVILVLTGQTEERPLNMVDLSYSYDEFTPTVPVATAFKRENVKNAVVLNNASIQIADFFSSEHSGTHMDAPYHFNKGQWTIEQIPLEIFEGPGVILDISNRSDADIEVTLDDINRWEKANGQIPEDAFVFMYSGWGKYAKNKTVYNGIEMLDNNQVKFHFPGFSEEACKFLIESRNVRRLGVDSLSVDAHGASSTFPCHQMMAKVNGVNIENLANLDRLPSTGSYIKAYPMKIAGGSGAPTRVIATIANPMALTQIS